MTEENNDEAPRCPTCTSPMDELDLGITAKLVFDDGVYRLDILEPEDSVFYCPECDEEVAEGVEELKDKYGVTVDCTIEV